MWIVYDCGNSLVIDIDRIDTVSVCVRLCVLWGDTNVDSLGGRAYDR